MNLYQKMARAFEIFAAYADERSGVAADHYFLYAGNPDAVSQEHRDELELLGWVQSDDSFAYTF